MQRFNTRFRAVVAALALSFGAGFASGDEYTFFLVESFDPSYPLAETSVLDINESNQAVGSDTFGGFLWDEVNEKTRLPYSSAKALNNLGQVVYNSGFYDVASGTFTSVPALGGGYPLVALRHMNDNGVGAGNGSHGGSGCEPFDCTLDCSTNLIWDAFNGSFQIGGITDLKAFYRVNNANVAIGQIVHLCDDEQAVVYNLDTGEWVNLSSYLPPLDLINYDAQTIPTDIGDAGHVVGTAVWGSDPQHGFVWTQSEGFTFLPPLEAGEVEYLFPEGVNTHGQVVGAAAIDTWQSGNFAYHAFVWDAQNGMRDLNDLTTLPPGFILDRAHRINDNGWIVGYGHFGPGWATSRGFVLKPIPPQVEGDVDVDGDVDLQDLAALLAAYGACDGAPAYVPAADFDGNGCIELSDLATLLANYGR